MGVDIFLDDAVISGGFVAAGGWAFEVADGLFSYRSENVVPKVRFELTRDIIPNGF